MAKNIETREPQEESEDKNISITTIEILKTLIEFPTVQQFIKSIINNNL